MSMLYYFFNVRNESQKLFEGLEISRNHELCEKWLNKWPTIFLTFKDIDGLVLQVRMTSWYLPSLICIRNTVFCWKAKEIDERRS